MVKTELWTRTKTEIWNAQKLVLTEKTFFVRDCWSLDNKRWFLECTLSQHELLCFLTCNKLLRLYLQIMSTSFASLSTTSRSRHIIISRLCLMSIPTWLWNSTNMSSIVLWLAFNCLEGIFANHVSLLRKPFYNFKVLPLYFTPLFNVNSNLVIMAL